MQPHFRKSHTALNKIYFWTATIHNWLPLLTENKNKDLVIRYMKQLSDANLITVYEFVLMPNHIHLIWKQENMNGKETPKESFLKSTAHEFLKKLKMENLSYHYQETSCKAKAGLHTCPTGQACISTQYQENGNLQKMIWIIIFRKILCISV